MTDRIEVGLRAVQRALTDVVAPALDPSEAQAHEQLRLAVDYIEFIRQRTHLLHDRDLVELRLLLRSATNVRRVLTDDNYPIPADLDTAITAAKTALAAKPTVGPGLQPVAAAAAAALAAVVDDSAALSAKTRAGIETAAIKGAATWIEFERSWYLPLGLDPESESVRDIDDVLADYQSI